MQKLTFRFALFLILFRPAFADSISPDNELGIQFDHTANVSEIPKVHKKIWPDFCLKHLQDDPEGCSAWDSEYCYKTKRCLPQLCFIKDKHSEAHIDRKLIDRLRDLSHLIPTSKNGNCDYAYCPVCAQTVIRGVAWVEGPYPYEDFDTYIFYPYYECECTEKIISSRDSIDEKHYAIYKGWQFCNNPAIHHCYFDWHHQTYFRHLENFLLYAKENPKCHCYWPQTNVSAKELSDSAYEALSQAIESSYLYYALPNFSPYMIRSPGLGSRAPTHTERWIHGFLSGLLTHTFFYSQYRDILSDLDQYSETFPILHSRLLDVEETIQQPFLKLYHQCIQNHPHPKIYYERGMILFHRGDTLDSLEDIRKFITYAEKNNLNDLLSSDLYLKEGQLLSECLSYDEALIALTKAIEKDSKNQEAYFERAIAYFETGDFSKALSDYLVSGNHPKKIDPGPFQRFDYVKFGLGMSSGILKGAQDSTKEFVPSLLSSFKGISRGLWAFVSHPLQISHDMVKCAYACLEFLKDYITTEKLDELVPELRECLKTLMLIDDQAKGSYVGHMIGKYGTDIFIGSGSVKAIHYYRNLRRANAIMTLETAAISPKLAQEVLELAAKEEALRYASIRSGNLKIHWDRQGKHIPGRHNYQPGKGIFEHPDPQRLVNEFAGTGQRLNHEIPGKPGYKERVDFQEYIGIWKNEEGLALPTTRGSISYGKDGTHIIPLKPK